MMVGGCSLLPRREEGHDGMGWGGMEMGGMKIGKLVIEYNLATLSRPALLGNVSVII